jgi:hypothetical protein
MNKKLHFLFFCLLLVIVLYLCKGCIQSYVNSGILGSSLVESFGNQIIIHPDNANLDPQETTFSVVTYDTDIDSGFTGVGICSDDSEWRKDDKTCRDYSLVGSNCEDIGSDGRLAFDACKVACDNCNTYEEIKRRLPSPVEDTEEPSYAQFEGSEGSEGSGDMGGADVRGIMSKLDDMDSRIGEMGVTIGASNAVDFRLSDMTEEMRSALQGLDTNGDGALTSEEFLAWTAGTGVQTFSQGSIGIHKINIINTSLVVAARLIELIELFKGNNNSPRKVADLPLTPVGGGTYNDLKLLVETAKTEINAHKTNMPNTTEINTIISVYKIIVYLQRLDLTDAVAVRSGSLSNDTYKDRLGGLEVAKGNLLKRLYNTDGQYDRAIHLPADATPLTIIGLMRRATVADRQITVRDLNMNDDDKLLYLNNVYNTLRELLKSINNFKNDLSSDIRGMEGTVNPVAGAAAGAAAGAVNPVAGAGAGAGAAGAAATAAAGAGAAGSDIEEDALTAAEGGALAGLAAGVVYALYVAYQ